MVNDNLIKKLMVMMVKKEPWASLATVFSWDYGRVYELWSSWHRLNTDNLKIISNIYGENFLFHYFYSSLVTLVLSQCTPIYPWCIFFNRHRQTETHVDGSFLGLGWLFHCVATTCKICLSLWKQCWLFFDSNEDCKDDIYFSHLVPISFHFLSLLLLLPFLFSFRFQCSLCSHSLTVAGEEVVDKGA